MRNELNLNYLELEAHQQRLQELAANARQAEEARNYSTYRPLGTSLGSALGKRLVELGNQLQGVESEPASRLRARAALR